MALIAFLLGTPSAAFYAVSSVLIGLVFGVCLYKKVSPEKTVFCVMLATVIFNLIDILFAAAISGISLEDDARSMQLMMQETLQKMMENSGQAVDEQTAAAFEKLLNINYLKRILIISTALAGALQGFLIYELGLLILRRLKIKVQKPKSIFQFKPPAWTGWVALVLFLLYFAAMQFNGVNERLQTAAMTIGMLGYLYLLIFGFIGGLLLLKRLMPARKILPVLLSFLGMMILPYLWMGLGFCYITGAGGFFDPTNGLFVEKML